MTRTLPALSITTYVMRFIIMIGAAISAVWYEVRHDLPKGQGFLIVLVVFVPVLLLWFFVERVAWNHDLRQKGISSDRETWDVTQFPQE